MTTSPGTFETIALQLETTVSSLITRASETEAMYLLGDLGLDITRDTFSPELMNAFRTLSEGASVLPELAEELKAAIAADDTLAMITSSAAIAAQVAAVIDSVVTLVNGLTGMNVPGLTPAELTDFVQNLPVRILEQLVVEHIEGFYPRVHAFALLFGLIEETLVNFEPAASDGSAGLYGAPHVRKRLRLDRLQTLLTDPEQLAHDLYNWGDTAFEADLLVGRLARVLKGLGVPVTRFQHEDGRWALEIFLLSLMRTEGATFDPPGLVAALTAELGEDWSQTFTVADGLELELAARASLGASIGVRILPPAEVELVPPSGTVQGTVSATLLKKPVAPDPTLTLLGVAGASGLFANKIGGGVTAGLVWNTSSTSAKGDFGIQGRIEGGKLRISADGADGFIAELLSGVEIEADFDLGFGWTSGGGVFFTGSSALQIKLPAHIELGPIELNALTLTVGLDGGTFPIGLGVDIGANLGPLAVTLERIGARAELSFPNDGKGNLGPVQIDFGFQPPTGAGLSLDAGVVRGGGYLFFDPDAGRYGGALELDIADIVTVAALGIITTKMPDGRPGTSLLIVITAEFEGIQLGYGFTLNGLGGILGLNRTMALDALVEGVRSGNLHRVMFPTNIVANATQIIADLESYFPVKRDSFLIGPLAKLGWGTPTLVTLSLGVVIEIPGNIAILGVLEVILPDEDAAILVLKVSFIGAIEFDKDRLWFFASLFGSRVLFMTIEGDMGLLVAWGQQPEFVISVGGFHPAFQPPPMPFPAPRRVAISILDESWGRIRVEAYFAVTSNTAQFGAKLDLFFGFSGLSISGHLALDALFQFSPFYFIISISGSLSLKVAGLSLLSIRLALSLEGPTPWRAKGSGSVSLLFFEISADFDFTWGDRKETTLPPIEVMPILAAAFDDVSNWSAQLPAATSVGVAIRKIEATEQLVLHPVGTLQISQRAVPLGIRIDKVGNRSASDAHQFSVTPPSVASFQASGEAREPFAIGQYQKLSNDESLSRSAFEPERSGLELSASGEGFVASRAVTRTVRYEQVIIDTNLKRFLVRFIALVATLFTHFLGRNAAALAKMSQANKRRLLPFDDKIAVLPGAYVVAAVRDNSIHAPAAASFSSAAQARQYLDDAIATDPGLHGQLHIIEGHEAKEAA